uniref:Uncharacterized protein n=1 Tax=Rhizophora mucronata TaxID=61149 RepID=A0A2P2NCZ6_RHIMU
MIVCSRFWILTSAEIDVLIGNPSLFFLDSKNP